MPGAAAGKKILRKFGNTQVAGDHASAEEGLFECVVALVADAQRAAHVALSAVAADEVLRLPSFGLAGCAEGGAKIVVCFGGVFRHPPGLQRDPFGVLGKFAHLPAETQCDVGTGARVLEQEALYVHLVGAVDGFKILVDTRRGDDGAHFFHFGWHHHARQFPGAVTGEVGNIGRVIGRKAEAAHLCGDAQAPVVLHGARVVRAALGVPARYFLVIEHDGLDAMAVEKQCEHQSDRTAAGDRYLSVQDDLSLSVFGEGGAFVATRIVAPGPDRMRCIRYSPQQTLATSGTTKPSRGARFTAADRARTCKSPLGGVV